MIGPFAETAPASSSIPVGGKAIRGAVPEAGVPVALHLFHLPWNLLRVALLLSIAPRREEMQPSSWGVQELAVQQQPACRAVVNRAPGGPPGSSRTLSSGECQRCFLQRGCEGTRSVRPSSVCLNQAYTPPTCRRSQHGSVGLGSPCSCRCTGQAVGPRQAHISGFLMSTTAYTLVVHASELPSYRNHLLSS